MLTLTTPVAVPNVTKLDNLLGVHPLDFSSGAVGIRLFYGAGQTRFQDFVLTLSDVAGGSRILALNAAPQGPADTFTTQGGGLINALTNAQNAYATARKGGTHAQGVKAMLLQLLTDGVLDPALTGT
jgi:hypothetical protein